ncbi:MAG TPA: galactokinase family protein [Marmoricola sp.]|nr:galactokinase family protein [Marmoricola sp.]
MEQKTYRAASAPGRVNLIGEHLDYNGGRCLPIALPMRTLAFVGLREAPSVVWETRPEAPDADPTAYVQGVLDALGVTAPLHVDISSDVPIGSGLSSSAALECSVALAADALLGLGLSPTDLVEACIRAETEYVGAPTGGLDQSAAILCRPGQALLLDFASGERTPVPFAPEEDGVDLLVIDTGASHTHTESGYGGRRTEAETARDRLGLEHLAEADESALGELPDELARRTRHVVTEQARVAEFVDAAGRRDWARCGAVMTASHTSLRDDYEVSSPELDAVVEHAVASGALGARMTGGGFGGSAIALVERDRVDAVRGAVDRAFAGAGWDAPRHHDGVASAGAHLEPDLLPGS